MTTTKTETIRDPNAPNIPVPTGSNTTPVNETEKEKQAQAQAILEGAKNKNPNWWDRNKDWLLPLIVALIAGAGGYTLFKILSPETASSVNTVLNNVDLDKNKNIGQSAENQTTENQSAANQTATNQQQQATANQTLSAVAQQTPTTPTDTQKTATANNNNGR